MSNTPLPTVEVSITSDGFVPWKVVVENNSLVRFTNATLRAHTATPDDGKSFQDTGDIPLGEFS
jgi:hypothetical protein